MNSDFINDNYLIVRNFIHQDRAENLAKQFKSFCEDKGILGDIQVPISRAKRNYLPFLELLYEKTQEISEIIGESILPTYCYSRIYKKGSDLKKHTDKDACEISITINLSGDEEWLFFIENPAGDEKSILLNPGDAILYLGCTAPHWRNEYLGEEYTQVFLHYVLSKGNRIDAYYEQLEYFSYDDTNYIQPNGDGIYQAESQIIPTVPTISNYRTLNIFPTSIYTAQSKNHLINKNKFYQEYHKYDFEQTKYNITVSENSGNPLLHLDTNLSPIFNEIIEHVRNYSSEVLGLKDIFNFVITKSWISRSKEKSHEIPNHIHSTSHISFIYYVNTSDDSHSLVFSNQHVPNSLFLGMYTSHEDKTREMLSRYTESNSESFYVLPREGDIIIFPSKTVHSTSSTGNDLKDERLAIVGDITLMLKEEYLSYSMGYIDSKFWKKY
jgi:hypothetical protein